jgi:pyruvate,orthophosphate dikinase
MDTVLNLGMNDKVVEGLAKKTDNPRFAWDSYRRFLEMFGNVVLEIPRSHFEDELDDIKYEKGVYEDSDLSAEDLQELVTRFKAVYETMDMEFPQDVLEQLSLSSTYSIYNNKKLLVVAKSILLCDKSYAYDFIILTQQ